MISSLNASLAANLQKNYDEMENLEKGETFNCDAYPRENDWLTWDGFILGPKDTPFYNGKYKVLIGIPTEFPNKPPTCSFLSPVPYHVNINPDGYICCEILKMSENGWKSSYTIKTMLRCLIALLANPNTKSVLRGDVLDEMRNDHEKYEKKAKETAENTWKS